jgi:hypothetical protein
MRRSSPTTLDHRLNFSLRKEILWESKTATDTELRALSQHVRYVGRDVVELVVEKIGVGVARN